jgi:hypothetical protein
MDLPLLMGEYKQLIALMRYSRHLFLLLFLFFKSTQRLVDTILYCCHRRVRVAAEPLRAGAATQETEHELPIGQASFAFLSLYHASQECIYCARRRCCVGRVGCHAGHHGEDRQAPQSLSISQCGWQIAEMVRWSCDRPCSSCNQIRSLNLIVIVVAGTLVIY